MKRFNLVGKNFNKNNLNYCKLKISLRNKELKQHYVICEDGNNNEDPVMVKIR